MKREAFEQFENLERGHWWFRGRRRVYLELLRRELGAARPRRVLDLGAGVGGFLEELGELGEELVYTELDREAVERLRERRGAPGVRADATALPFEDMSFDLVCLFDVLEHIVDERQALREVLRVLSPGGYALLSVPAHPWLWSENDRVAQHVRRYTRRGLVDALTGAGLLLQRCTFANALLFPAIASFLVVTEAARKLHLAPRGATNLSLPWPRSLDSVCYRLFVSELALSRRVDLPLGHSLVAIARRRDYAVTPLLRREPLPRAAAVAIDGSLAGP